MNVRIEAHSVLKVMPSRKKDAPHILVQTSDASLCRGGTPAALVHVNKHPIADLGSVVCCWQMHADAILSSYAFKA